MQNRRSFLKQSSLFTLGSFMLANKAQAFLRRDPHAVGLQLYTLFNTIDDDVPGSLQKVADIGYKEIESAFSKKGGFYGLSAKDFNKLLQDKGLSWKSHHVLGAPFKLPKGHKMPTGPDGKPIVLPPIKNLRDNAQEVIDDLAAAGVPYLVCASTPIETAEEIKASIATLNKAAEAAHKAGITLAYHNHYTEFNKVDGQLPYDHLLNDTDPQLLKMELDLCWVTKAGVDPVELFKKNPGRFPLWHVKDIDKSLTTPQPVGTGVVDFKRIFEHAQIAGMQHFFVEHDMPADPYASITTSFKNIAQLLG